MSQGGSQQNGRSGHTRTIEGKERAQFSPRRRHIWAPNGLRFRPLVCAWCGHHFGNETVERGYLEKTCPQCKALCEFHIDRTQEPRNYDAYVFQERQMMNLEAMDAMDAMDDGGQGQA